MTALIEDYRPAFMGVTFAFLAFAFYVSYRPRSQQGGGEPRARIMTLNRAMLWAVTAIAVVFLFFPQVVTDLFASSDEFTADMQRTVISIEGMT